MPRGSERIFIFDTTLRDGEQAPRFSMTLDEKIMLAEYLERLGVDIIEPGFPTTSEGDFKAVSEIAKLVKGCEIVGLARANEKDIEIAWEAVKAATYPRLKIILPTSDIHLNYQLRKSRKEVQEMGIMAVKKAKGYTPNVEFSAVDAMRSDQEYLAKVIESTIKAGATTVNISDTVGYALPSEIANLINYLKKNVNNLDKAIISIHCHNDLGLAVANSLMAVMHGARQVECTINGIGERAGNASLEEVVMIFRTRRDLLPFETRIVTELLKPVSKLLTRITGVKVHPHKPIVGENIHVSKLGSLL